MAFILANPCTVRCRPLATILWHLTQRTYWIFLFPFSGKLLKYLIQSFRVLFDPAEYLKCSRGLFEAEIDPGNISLIRYKISLSFWLMDTLIPTVCGRIWTLKLPSPSINPDNQALFLVNRPGPIYLILVVNFLFTNFISSINRVLYFVVINWPLTKLINSNTSLYFIFNFQSL